MEPKERVKHKLFFTSSGVESVEGVEDKAWVVTNIVCFQYKQNQFAYDGTCGMLSWY